MNARTATAGSRLLVLLMLIFAVNMLDRQILGIALSGIRAEFHLSDSALGLLTGPAFALIYVLAGIPMATLADRGHRRTVIAASLGVFSIMTLLCGAAANFTQLVAARFGVGLGEAGTAPALNAVIAKHFPPDRRSGALSVYAAGGNLGLLLAFFGGGLIMQHWGWRITLMCAAIPGLMLMIVFLAAYRLPEDRAAAAQPMPLLGAMRVLWSCGPFRLVALACGLTSVSGYAGLAFAPSFLQRSYHLAPAQIGLLLAVLVGVVGFAGTMLPGLLSDRMGGRGAHRGMKVATVTVIAAIPFHAMVYLAHDLRLTILGLVFTAFFASSYLGPSLAATQNLVPEGMRAQAAALLLAALNLIGMAVGPQLVGIISDLLRPALGEESLRYALLTSMVPSAAAA